MVAVSRLQFREENKRSPATLNRVGEAMAIAFARKALEGKEPPRERTAEMDMLSCEMIKWAGKQ